MAFFINLAPQYLWATIHDDRCASARPAGQTPRPDNWRGPFATVREAEEAGRKMGFRASLCRVCKRRLAKGGVERQG